MNFSLRETAVIIPTLDERDSLPTLLEDIFHLLPEISVLVCDDRSSDGTPETVIELQARFPNLHLLRRGQPFGYGPACLEGMRWAIARGYRAVITMDADHSHDHRIIPNLIGGLAAADVTIGSRYVRGGHIENWSFHRRLLSRFANQYVRVILGFPIHDVTTGFNAYRADVLARVLHDDIRSNGYAFLVELKYRLLKAGATFIECPITFRERRGGVSKMSKKVIWESIWLPWRLSRT